MHKNERNLEQVHLYFNIGGNETTISVNGGGTYEELIDEIVQNINAMQAELLLKK